MVMRVLKLGLMAVLGYAAYQFIRGILEGEEAIEVSRNPAPQSAPRSEGAAPILTGGGEGRVVTTSDALGTSIPHRVGRGVVRR
jgi:hypothetical protein